MTATRPAPRTRLWPAALIAGAGGLWLARVWLTGESSRQERTLRTLVTAALIVVALTLWLAFLSRLSRRIRFGGAGAIVAVLLAGAALFRIRGVTGDLVPVLEPRWGRAHPAAPSDAVPEASARTAAAGEPPALLTPRPAASAEPGRPVAASSPARETTTRKGPAVHPAYPQFLGPGRDATLSGPRLVRDWTAHPPRRLWRQQVGEGWSGFAVDGGIAVTHEQANGDEQVVAYDFSTGRRLWSHADPARYSTVIAGTGPRATPTIAGGRVFTLGATGILNALDLATGRRLWTHDVVEENGATLPDWGKSCSPLVLGGRVIVSAGGKDERSLVAYAVETGERAWSAGADRSSYSSPVLLEIGGRRQIVILNQNSIAGHDPESGTLLWQQEFPGQQPNVATPIPLPGDRLLVSAGYGVGSKAYRLNGDSGSLQAKLLWESPRLKSKFANFVFYEGSVYGLDDGVLTCVDPETGARRWKGGRYGHGQLLLVGGLLLVQGEDGEVVLLEPSAAAPRELTRFEALDGKTWNPPALAGRVLLVRNDREAAAYELPVE